METQTAKKTRKKAAAPALPWRWAALFVLALLVVTALVLRFAGFKDELPEATSEPEPETVETEPPPEPLDVLRSYVKSAVPVPPGYHLETRPAEDVATGTLVLVNNEHHFDPEAVTELLSVYQNKTEHYQAKDWELSVAPEMLEALNAWLEAGYEEGEVLNVNVVGGYRSYETQKNLHDNAELLHGREYADRYISLPGASEHHTGYAVDLSVLNWYENTSEDFTGEDYQAWLAEHAWEYGLILRYPDGKEELTGIAFESWHYRYVGLPHAQIITERGLCLEEYIELLRGYTVLGEHLCGECQGRPYEIYFCPADALVLPNDVTNYTISGNNVDGFIVTIY